MDRLALKHHQYRYDISLVVKDGKEFQAHRDVLSQASPFFEKLLNSDMKESNEGIIRLEMIKESQMADILQFIYTGDVQISTQENAENLIEIADYLLLSNLKAFAGKRLEQHMTTLNCISIYHVAEKFQCEDLFASACKFICSNFSTVAASKDFLNVPSREVERYISSDEIVIDAEENVFEIILRWIEHAKSERSEKFGELFRHVRLTCVSRDFLVSDVVTNDLVKENEDCLESVTAALQWIDRPADCNVSRPHPPRKALERDVMVVTLCNFERPDVHTSLYLPATEEWYRLPPFGCYRDYVISYQGKVFVVTSDLDESLCYDPELNRWSPAPWTKLDSNLEDHRKFMKLRSPAFQVQCVSVVKNQICFISMEWKESAEGLVLWRYNTDLNSVTSLFNWTQKLGFCSVVVDKYIYVIGGRVAFGSGRDDVMATASAAKFDTEENTWQEIAPLQEARSCALGVSKNEEKIFIAGGFGNSDAADLLKTCEVYNISTDEWQFIASLTVPRMWGKMVLIDEAIYVLGGVLEKSSVDKCILFPDGQVIMESYDHERDKWNERAIIPSKEIILTMERFRPISDQLGGRLDICSLRLFKGIKFSNLEPIQF